MSDLSAYKRNMKTYFQILPPQNSNWDNVKIADDNKTIYVRCMQDFQKREKAREPVYWKFETDGVFNTMNQEAAFNEYIKPSLQYALMGVDVLIFAYGQTGSGKSTTINGLLNNFDNRGIAPRLITELFALKEEVKHESKVKFQITFVEIYKSYIVDLIHHQSGFKIRTPFKNIHRQKIDTEAEGWKYLFQGEGRRKIIKFDKYYSHVATSICTIFIRRVSKVISNPVEKFSKIHIIDMSGIDTYGNASAEIKHPLDIGSANLDKAILERCILIIQDELRKERRAVKDAVPLISYLGDSLSAHSFSIFIGHIRISQEDLRITISALQFSNLIKQIKDSKLKASVITTNALSVKNLQHSLEVLQEQMYLNSMLKNNDLSFNLTQNRVEQIQHAIHEYIQNKASELSVLNVTDAIIALNVFREICNKLEADNTEAMQKIAVLSSKTKVNAGGRMSSTLSSRVPEHKPSIKRRASGRRVTSDAVSRASRASHRQSIASHSTNKSTTGMTLGHLLSSSYHGDPTKSLIPSTVDRKSKILEKKASPHVHDRYSRISEQMFSALSDFNLENVDPNNIESIWQDYQKDLTYNFAQINNSLETIMLNSKDVLKEYNALIDKLNKKTEVIDFKKYDLLKLTLYQGMTSLQCAVGREKHLNETKQRLSAAIVALMEESIQIKEDILTLLANLKIMVQQYTRHKKELNKNFILYCTNTFHLKMPPGDQVLESIEDDLATLDTKEKVVTENPVKALFTKFQNTLKRNRLINNNLL